MEAHLEEYQKRRNSRFRRPVNARKTVGDRSSAGGRELGRVGVGEERETVRLFGARNGSIQVSMHPRE